MRHTPLWLVVGLACADLGPRPTDLCGNGIYEPENSEDCDGDAACIAADQPHSCFWSCEEAACPDGFTCGPDRVCRKPAYALERGETIGSGRVVWLRTHDFDNDGIDDLIAIEATVDDTEGVLSVTYLGAEGKSEQRWEWPGIPREPAFADMDGDGLTDLFVITEASVGALGPVLGELATDRGIVFLRNAGDRTFDPVPAAQHWDVREKISGVTAGPVGEDAPEVKGNPDVPVLLYDERAYRVDESGDTPVVGSPHASLAASVNALSFSRLPDPRECEDPGLAVMGGTGPDPAGRVTLMFPDCAFSVERTLEAPASSNGLAAWVEFVDLNGDPFPDLVIQGTGMLEGAPDVVRQLWPAYGVADGTFHSDRLALPDEAGDAAFAESPIASWPTTHDLLAVGHLDGDGSLDFVIATDVAVVASIALSGDPCGSPDPSECRCGSAHACANTVLEAEYSHAAIADFSGDGASDIALAGAVTFQDKPFVSILSRRNESFEEHTHIVDLPEHAITSLAAGDFDKDHSDDLALSLEGPGVGDDEIHTLWGGAEPELDRTLAAVELEAGLAVASQRQQVKFGDTLLAVAYAPDQQRSGILRFQHLQERATVAPIRVSGSDVPIDPTSLQPVDALSVFAGSFIRPDEVWLAVAPGEYGCALGLVLEADSVLRVAAQECWTDIDGNLKDFGLSHDSRITRISGDFDSDAIDEIVILFFEDFQNVIAPHTRPATIDRKPSGFELVSSHVIEHVGVTSPWPKADGIEYEVEDVDGDGDLDIALLGEDLTNASAGLAVVLDNDGDGSFDTRPVTGASAPRTWAFIGSLGQRAAVAAFVDGEELHVAAFDGEHLTVEWSAPAPEGVRHSETGDFNTDGLADLALATENGTILYFGVPSHAP